MKRRRGRSRDETAKAAAWREATSETAPRHLWTDAVELAAIRKGADAAIVRKNARIRSILSRAYNAGEPVWMAADEVAFVAKESAKPRMLSPREELRAARALWFTHGPGKARDQSRLRASRVAWGAGGTDSRRRVLHRYRVTGPGVDVYVYAANAAEARRGAEAKTARRR